MASLADVVNSAANLFSAIGTVGAFATGFVLLRREQRREEARSEEDRRSQAVKVSAWVEAERNRDGDIELWFRVHNASDMPLYEVEILLPARPGEPVGAEHIGLVPPGQTVSRRAPRSWLGSYYAPEPVQIEFLDSSGWTWTRDEQGFLVRSSEKAIPAPREATSVDQEA